MDNLLNNWLPTLDNFHYLIYWLAFFAALLETVLFVGLLIPGSTALLFVGAYAATGNVDIVGLWGFAVVGAVLGDNVNYYLGKRHGKRWLINGIWVFKPEHFELAHSFFNKHGAKSVFLGRFVPTVKEVIPFIAGSAEMKLSRFFLWNVLGAMGWGLQWLGAGYLFAQSLSLAQLWLSRLGMMIAVVVLIALLLWFLQAQVIKHGAVIYEFSVSLWHSFYHAFQENEKVKAWKISHPKAMGFIKNRFDRTHFKGRTLTFLSLALFYVLILFGGIVEDIINSDTIVSVDKSIAQLVLAFREADVLQAFIWMTEWGNWQVAIPMALFASLIFMVSKRWLLILPMMVSVLGSEGLALLGKIAFHRPRPVEAVLYEHTFSFPSGHATIATALYGFLAYVAIRSVTQWSTKVKLFFFALIFIGLLGLSRIMVGVHYLSDVWAGYLVGTIWLIIAISLTEWLVARKYLDLEASIAKKSRIGVTLLMVLAVCYYLGFATLFQPHFAPKRVAETIVLKQDLSSLLNNKKQQFTQTLLGKPQQPISLKIIAKDEPSLLGQLHQAGWVNAAEANIYTVFQQLKHKNDTTQISIAPAFWQGNINQFALIKPRKIKPQKNSKELDILYLWKTPYIIENKNSKAHVYVGMTRMYSDSKWLFLHTINPDIDASRSRFLTSLQKNNRKPQHCIENFVPEMTGEYLLKGHFFTRGKLLEINLLDSVMSNPAFCSVKREVK